MPIPLLNGTQCMWDSTPEKSHRHPLQETRARDVVLSLCIRFGKHNLSHDPAAGGRIVLFPSTTGPSRPPASRLRGAAGPRGGRPPLKLPHLSPRDSAPIAWSWPLSELANQVVVPPASAAAQGLRTTASRARRAPVTCRRWPPPRRLAPPQAPWRALVLPPVSHC
jgi:hypothetical protein